MVSGGTCESAADDATTSRSPRPRSAAAASRSGSARRARSTTPVRLVLTIVSTASAGVSSTSAAWPIAALRTTASSRPCSSRTRSTSAARSPPTATSAGIPTTPGTPATASASRASSRAQVTTRAPEAASRRTTVRPMPALPPVTRTTRSRRSVTGRLCPRTAAVNPGSAGRCVLLVDAQHVALAVPEPGRPPHARERGDLAVPADPGHVRVDLELDALGLEVVHLGLDVGHVPLGDGVPRLAGVGGLVDVEAGAGPGLVDQVDALDLPGRGEAQLVRVEGLGPGEVGRGDVRLDPAGSQHGALPTDVPPWVERGNGST